MYENYNEYNNYQEQRTYNPERVNVQTILTKAFLFMFLALLITGITALIVANSVTENGAIGRFIYGNKWSFAIFLILEIVIVFACNSAMSKNNLTLSAVLFFVYSIVNGLTLSVIFLVYTTTSITRVFFIASAIFGVMACIGAFTKINLSRLGPILLVGLICLIVAEIINIFIGSTTMDMIISAVGVLVFVGLTAYDVQKIKNLPMSHQGYNENVLGLYGAMELYLDFINLFLYLLRLFGNAKD